MDDDEAVRDSMRVLLESYGVTVEDYSSARDFLIHAQSHQSDCMLLDLHMPDMDGLQLLDAMRKQGSSLPVIIVTAGGNSMLSGRALQAGAHALLDKPVKDDLLLQSIRSAVCGDYSKDRAAASLS